MSGSLFLERFPTSATGLKDTEMPGSAGLFRLYLEHNPQQGLLGGSFSFESGNNVVPSLSLGRFMQELTEMLGFRPYQFYYYTWKYVSPICMAVLMTASIIQLGVSPPGYSAWIREEVSTAPAPAAAPTWAWAEQGGAEGCRPPCSSLLCSSLLLLLDVLSETASLEF